MNERNLLSLIKHSLLFYNIFQSIFIYFILNSFLVNMVCAFQDRDNLYLVIDIMLGGDLRYLLSKKRSLTENESSNYHFVILQVYNKHYFKIF